MSQHAMLPLQVADFAKAAASDVTKKVRRLHWHLAVQASQCEV